MVVGFRGGIDNAAHFTAGDAVYFGATLFLAGRLYDTLSGMVTGGVYNVVHTEKKAQYYCRAEPSRAIFAPLSIIVKPSFRNFSKKRISIPFLTNIDIIADSP